MSVKVNVKVSVEDLDSTNQILHDLDSSKSLEENIDDIKERFKKPEESKPGLYGLKLLSTNSGVFRNVYITKDNFDEIKDGYFLKLVYSLSYLIDRIFSHLDDLGKERSFEDLSCLSTDPEFIKELARTGKHITLIDYFIENKEMTSSEIIPCLIVIVHLFLKGLIQDITHEFLDRVLELLRNPDSNEDVLKYALSVFHKILCQRDRRFDVFKEKIIIELPFKVLLSFIENYKNKDLHTGALLLINTIIRYCKDPQRTRLIKEISNKHSREKVFKHVIESGDIDKTTAHELYVYQTYVLSLLSSSAETQVTISETMKREFEVARNDIERKSGEMEFSEEAVRYKNISLEDLTTNEDTRYSLVSITSTGSENTILSKRSSNILDEDTASYGKTISKLTLEALRYFKETHYNNFCLSQVEEQIYEPGIFSTSERVMKILTKLLHVGKDPEKTHTTYQPIFFSCPDKHSFIFQLFCRTMWLLSKTRKEMKTSTYDDYPKLIKVLEKQIKMVLQERPLNFKILTNKMAEINYEKVAQQWQKEKEQRTHEVLNNNPCVQELRTHYTSLNEDVVFQQRMNVLHKGQHFNKIVDNKRIHNAKVWLRVCDNNRQFTVGDWDQKAKKYIGGFKTYSVSNITHIVEGKACTHLKNDKEEHLVFSIILNHSEYLNFTADKSETVYYWTDGFYMLTGKPNRSKLYHSELKELVDMDLVLHLVELQEVAIPKKPPPVPLSPFDPANKPQIPPRSPHLLSRISRGPTEWKT